MREENKRIVEPFNEIYTHDCFMNTLLCAAKHYELDYPMLTLNKGYSYSIDGEKLSGHSVILFPIDELTQAIGLKIDKEKDCIENWREEYRILIERGGIIIAPVDDYYNPLRVDAYKKEHLPHYILIYDMDNSNEILSVIESRYRTTVSYKNMEIRYDDYEKSHFQTDTLYKYIYRKNKSCIKKTYINEYLHNSIQLTEQSVVNLKEYIRYLSVNGIPDIKTWLMNMNDICNQVKVERYVFEKVFYCSELFNIAADIYQTWYLLRTRVAKLSMLNQSDNIVSKIISYLEKIEKLEKDKVRAYPTLEAK